MIKPLLVGVVAASLTASMVSAESFSFTVKNLTMQESHVIAGGYGDYGSVMINSSSGIKAPKLTSSRPLYGVMHRNNNQGKPTVILDESKGTGKGYDRLIFDINENGDFTDDPVFNGTPANVNSSNDDYEQNDFGPIELPAKKTVGIWRPRFYVNVYLYNKRELKSATKDSQQQIGQIRLQAGNLLEAQVDINGIKQKIGLIDGNCNFTLGDPVSISKVYRRANDPGSWYLAPGDSYVRDIDGSGKYQRSQAGKESEIFSKYVYFRGKPYLAKVSEDLKSVSFEPFTGLTGEFKLDPTVTRVVFGLEGTTWEAVTPEIVEGKVVVPVGNYHISTCMISAKDASGVVQANTTDVPDKMFAVKAGQATDLQVGQPLKLSILAEKQPANGNEPAGMGSSKNLFSSTNSNSKQSYVLQMNVQIAGAATEKYSGFTRDQGGYIAAPRFQILDVKGKELASGNFEYG
jgi:hypothetical protein